jgi:hypothetical protein
MTLTPIASEARSQPAQSIARSAGVFALWIAGMLAGGCSDPPGLIAAQPPGVDPRVKLERELARNSKEPSTPDEDIPELAVLGANTPPPTIPPAPPTAKGETRKTASGTIYETVREGSGETAKSGQRVSLHYTGTFDDGRVFDSTKGKDPFTASIGKGQVIKGWDEAIPGMKVGEVRKLTVPPSSGYGSHGKGQVPANATLLFEVELLKVE